MNEKSKPNQDLIQKIKEMNMQKNYDNHPLIGQKVNLKTEEHKIKFLDKDLTMTSYTLDDPHMQKLIQDTFPDVRIFPPGTMGTADYKPFRVNVNINEQGIITSISNG